MNKLIFNKRRDLGDILGDSITFLWEHSIPLLKVIFYYVGPFILLGAISSSLWMSRFGMSNAFDLDNIQNLDAPFQIFTPSYFLLIFTGIMSICVFFTVFMKYLKLHQESEDGKVDISKILHGLFGQVLWVLATYIILAFLIVIALFLFLIPGIVLLVYLSIFYPIRFFEKTSFGETFSRSFSLISGHWWQTFGLGIVVVIVGAIFNIAAALPGGLISGLSLWFEIPLPVSVSAVINTLGQILGFFVYAFSFMTATLWYSNLLEIKEAKSTFQMVEEFGQEEDKVKKKLDDFSTDIEDLFR